MSDSPKPDEEVTRYKRELDKARVEALYRSATERGKFVIDFAMLGLRSLTLVNGGAIVGILTFLGHNEHMAVRPALWAGFSSLIAGLALSLIAIVCAYVAQHLFSFQDHHGADKIFFIARGDAAFAATSERGEDKYEKFGTWAQMLAVGTAVASFGCFAYGALKALAGLAEASVSPLM
ncbi:MAG: hypothetical protein AB7G40_14475 [Hyphomonadaceae bacterium]